MDHRRRILSIKLALTLMVALFAPQLAAKVHAAATNLYLEVVAPYYGQPGQTITYEVILQNPTSQTYTNIAFYDSVPANTTYVSGGVFNAGANRVEFTLANLAPNTTYRVTWVARVASNVAIGTLITNSNFSFLQYTPGNGYELGGAVSTVVEAPGTLVAVYKNANGTPFNVTVNGYQFANYGNEAPRNANDDLSKTDVFELFGPGVCQSGTTAATCVLSGPAQAWLKEAIASMADGHCDGMAATSLRLFTSLPFRQYSSPATFQAGAANSINLNFPAQPIENYIAHYFHTQDFIWDSHIAVTPVQTVDKLIADFNKTPPIGYTINIFKTSVLDRSDENSWEDGHAVAAYGVERVNATEDRILIYDNNFPNQRKYITVNRAANTWRYATAATPGQPEDVYAGTAASLNMHLIPVSARDLPAGQYFACPFCNTGTVASAQANAPGLVSGNIYFDYTGEGAILVVNDQDQSTGFAFDTETFINEIPGAQLFHFVGGLGKDVPPLIKVPFSEADSALYSVYISGKTIDSVADGGLIMTGNGFAMGMNSVQLDPDELLELTISPDGDFIAFNSTQTMAAPPLYIAYDPVSDQDPSVIFDVSGPTLTAGEQILITLEPDFERVYFDDTGTLGQQFTANMRFVWPDGDEQNYVQSVDVPAGATSAFIDFGAWDGLLSPAAYVDNVLQNPSINHRLKLLKWNGAYTSTPQPNAPAGVYHVEATFTNVTEVSLANVYFTVANLGAGNVVLNADGGPAGGGAAISVPAAVLGSDGILSANESFTFGFDVGLATPGSSTLTVDANGEPYDWTYNATPKPTYDANNASFVFGVHSGATLATCGSYSVMQTVNGSIVAPGFAGTIRVGTNSNDALPGTTGPDLMVGLKGNDRLDGKDGNDLLCGGDGNDTLIGANGHDGLDGDAGIDILSGGNGLDILNGGNDPDALTGDNDDDRLDGGNDIDLMSGGNGNDRLFGSDGNDALDGNHGDDALDGGPRIDYCNGGTGNDTGVNCEIKISAAAATVDALFAQLQTIADNSEADVEAIRQLLIDYATQAQNENDLSNTLFLPLISK